MQGRLSAARLQILEHEIHTKPAGIFLGRGNVLGMTPGQGL